MRVALIDLLADPRAPGAPGHSDIVWNLARHLARLDTTPVVVGPYLAAPQSAGIEVAGYRASALLSRTVLGHLLMARRACARAARIGPDAVLAPEYLSTGVAVGRLPEVPVVLWTPGNIFERLERGVNAFGPLQKQVYKRMARRSAEGCAAIVATSRNMERWWLRSGADRSRLWFIPLGVDVGLFRPQRGARARLALPEEQHTLLFVGRLDRENDVARVLAVFDEVARRDGEAFLHVVGDGPEGPRLMALVVELGLGDRVAWHGRVGQVLLSTFYAAADLVLLVRTWGGLPRVVLETMACGTPVVAPRSDLLADIVEDGVTGYLAPSDRVAEMAEAVLRALSDRAALRLMGERARQFAEEHLAWPVVARRLRQEVLAAVARSKRVAA